MPRKIKTRKRRVGGMKRYHDEVSDSGVEFVAHDDLDSVLEKKEKLAIDEGRFEDLSTLPSDDESDGESSSSASSSSSSSSSSAPSPQPPPSSAPFLQPPPSSAEQKPAIVKLDPKSFLSKMYTPIRGKYIKLNKPIWDHPARLKKWARVVSATNNGGEELLAVEYPPGVHPPPGNQLRDTYTNKVIPTLINFSDYWNAPTGILYKNHLERTAFDREEFEKKACNIFRDTQCNVMGGKKKKRNTRKRKKTKRRNKKTRKPKVKRTKGRK